MRIPTRRGRYARRNPLRPLAVVVAALAVLVLLLASCADGAANFSPVAEVGPTELQNVEDECDGEEGDPGWAFVYTADAGKTLIIDHKGEDDADGASVDQLVCVMALLGVPDAVLTRMDSTRAMDGVQHADWDGYTATWSYHPDTGLDVIIEEA